MRKYNNLNFFKHTYCEFQLIQNDFFKQKSTHFKSKSGSLYFYTNEGVYRYSNHWGRVANCRWKISSVKDYKNQNYYIGYANWIDFFPLNTSEKNFYLEVDFLNKEVEVCCKRENDTTTNFLMTLDLALKKLKQIKTIFKEYKWAYYFNENIDVLRKELILNLVSTQKDLHVLKQDLKNKKNKFEAGN